MSKSDLANFLNKDKKKVFENIKNSFNDIDALSLNKIDIYGLVHINREEDNLLGINFSTHTFIIKSILLPYISKLIFKTYILKEDFTKIPSEQSYEEIKELFFEITLKRTEQTLGNGKLFFSFIEKEEHAFDEEFGIKYIKKFCNEVERREKDIKNF